MTQLPQQCDRLQPSKTFLNPLPLLMVDPVTGLARHAPSITLWHPVRFCATCGVTRSCRRSATNPAVSNPLSMAAVRHPLPGLQHLQRRPSLGRARRFSYRALDNQRVAIFHQKVPDVAQLRLLAHTFARKGSFSTRAFGSTGSRHEHPQSVCPDRPAEMTVSCPRVEKTLRAGPPPPTGRSSS